MITNSKQDWSDNENRIFLIRFGMILNFTKTTLIGLYRFCHDNSKGLTAAVPTKYVGFYLLDSLTNNIKKALLLYACVTLISYR